jgi:ATP-dependent Lhr-like helicase
VTAERTPGGFASAYAVLKAAEDAGRCRRGYFVEGLGGAQFAMPGAVERLRSMIDAGSGSRAIVLAATDPGNPFGAALPWPDPTSTAAHRPGRKAGATVVVVDGNLALYVEKGGRSLLTYTEHEAAIEALAGAVRAGMLDSISIERVNGQPIDNSFSQLLKGKGFVETPKGMRLRRQ